MISVDSAIQDAVQANKVPSFQPGNIRDLVMKLGMPFPVSIRDLLAVLNNLPPATAVFSSESIEANYVRGSAQLGIQGDGLYSFRGNLHENGEFGDYYFVAAVLLDVRDSSGKTLVIAHQGSVAGQLAIGASDDSFQDNGFSELLKDNWDVAKNSRVEFILNVFTNPFEVSEVIGNAVLVALGVAIVAIFGTQAAANCTWQTPGTNPDGSPHGLRCEWNRTPGDLNNPSQSNPVQ